MNTAAIRRRGYGGESTPVMEIIHPDAFYIKTNEYAGPDSSLLWQRDPNIANATKVIVDGVESTSPDNYFKVINGINTFPLLSGVHEYYIYFNSWGTRHTNIGAYNTGYIYRFPRKFNIHAVGLHSNQRPIQIIITSNEEVNVSGLTIDNIGALYVPSSMYDYYKENAIHVANIIPVKYKFIED